MNANSGRVPMLRRLADAMEPVDGRVLARSVTGRPIPRLSGAEPDDEDDDEDEDDSDSDKDSEGTDSSGGGKPKGDSKNKDKSDSDEDDSDDDDTVSRQEHDRLRKRMKAADRRANAAEAALRDKESGGKDDKEVTPAVKVEDSEEYKTVAAANRSLRLQVALLSDNTVEWHNPEDVLRELADDDDVDIDEDGKVHGVKDALKRLAKRKPYLVKPPPKQARNEDDDSDDDSDDSDDDSDDDDSKSKAKRRSSRSGSPMNGGNRSRDQKAQRQKLVERYPALRRS